MWFYINNFCICKEIKDISSSTYSQFIDSIFSFKFNHI